MFLVPCKSRLRRAKEGGGGRGIRTPGSLSTSVVFKTTAIDHSAIPPRRELRRKSRDLGPRHSPAERSWCSPQFMAESREVRVGQNLQPSAVSPQVSSGIDRDASLIRLPLYRPCRSLKLGRFRSKSRRGHYEVPIGVSRRGCNLGRLARAHNTVASKSRQAITVRCGDGAPSFSRMPIA